MISTLAKSFLSLTECSQMPSCPPLFKYLDTQNCQINVPKPRCFSKTCRNFRLSNHFAFLQLVVFFFESFGERCVTICFEFLLAGNFPKLQFCCHGSRKHHRGCTVRSIFCIAYEFTIYYKIPAWNLEKIVLCYLSSKCVTKNV